MRLLFCLGFGLSSVWGVNLDSLYRLAEPGEGYDRLLVLDSFQVYEGGFAADAGRKSCLRGCGAIIDLSKGTSQIRVTGDGTSLDIERCVVKGQVNSAALAYTWSAAGRIDHLTIVENYDGVKFWGGKNLSMKNTVITSSKNYGIATVYFSLDSLRISHSDVWNSQAGNYMYFYMGC